MYTLNLHNIICQLYPSNAEGKENFQVGKKNELRKVKMQSQIDFIVPHHFPLICSVNLLLSCPWMQLWVIPIALLIILR